MIGSALWLSGLVVGSPPPPAVDKVVAEARASRNAIKSYHLVVRREQRFVFTPGKEDTETVLHTVWSDGDRKRTDTTVQATSEPDGVGWRQVICRNCERRGYALDYSIRPKTHGIVKYRKLDAQFDAEDPARIDWRGLGLLHADLMRHLQVPPDQTLVELQSHGATAALDTVGGAAAVRLRLRGPNGGGTDCWLRPDRGMNPVRYVTGSDSDPTTKQTTDIEYRRHEAAGVWFPTHIHHHRKVDGNLVVDQRVTVERADLNTPIPPEVFTLAGLDLKDKTAIALPEIKKSEDQPLWRNGKLDYTYTAGQQAADTHHYIQDRLPAQPDVGPPTRWPLFAAAAGLAVVAVVTALLALRWRSRP